MINAKEAKQIMRGVDRYKDELKNIEPYIIKAAKKGKDHVALFSSVPFSVQTIDKLIDLGYMITPFEEPKGFTYRIEWMWMDKDEQEGYIC